MEMGSWIFIILIQIITYSVDIGPGFLFTVLPQKRQRSVSGLDFSKTSFRKENQTVQSLLLPLNEPVLRNADAERKQRKFPRSQTGKMFRLLLKGEIKFCCPRITPRLLAWKSLNDQFFAVGLRQVSRSQKREKVTWNAPEWPRGW